MSPSFFTSQALLAEDLLLAVAVVWCTFCYLVTAAGVYISYKKYGPENAAAPPAAFPPSSLSFTDERRPPTHAAAAPGLPTISDPHAPVTTSPPPPPAAASTDDLLAPALPRVSILRPLKGLDTNIERNLDACFHLEYPRACIEIIFCVADHADPVIPLVHDLMRRYARFDIKLYVGEAIVGINPKINNLIRGYDAARHDIVWVLDSNIWVAPQTLMRSVAALSQPGIGLVHHLPVGIQPKSFGSQLEYFFLNVVHARVYLGINWLAPASCVIGKSTLFRRSDLALCGGLRAFGKYMAEDNMVGQALWDLGLRHAMTPDRAWQALGNMSAADFFSRRQRWGRIRKYTVRVATAVEPFTECLILSGIFACVVRALWTRALLPLAAALASGGYPSLAATTAAVADLVPPFPLLYAVHAAAWFWADWAVACNVAHHARLPFPAFAAAWLVREITALPTYVWAVTGSTVAWRDCLYELRRGGTVELASDAAAKRAGGRPAAAVVGKKRVEETPLSVHQSAGAAAAAASSRVTPPVVPKPTAVPEKETDAFRKSGRVVERFGYAADPAAPPPPPPVVDVPRVAVTHVQLPPSPPTSASGSDGNVSDLDVEDTKDTAGADQAPPPRHPLAAQTVYLAGGTKSRAAVALPPSPPPSPLPPAEYPGPLVDLGRTLVLTAAAVVIWAAIQLMLSFMIAIYALAAVFRFPLLDLRGYLLAVLDKAARDFPSRVAKPLSALDRLVFGVSLVSIRILATFIPAGHRAFPPALLARPADLLPSREYFCAYERHKYRVRVLDLVMHGFDPLMFEPGNLAAKRGRIALVPGLLPSGEAQWDGGFGVVEIVRQGIAVLGMALAAGAGNSYGQVQMQQMVALAGQTETAAAAAAAGGHKGKGRGAAARKAARQQVHVAAGPSLAPVVSPTPVAPAPVVPAAAASASAPKAKQVPTQQPAVKRPPTPAGAKRAARATTVPAAVAVPSVDVAAAQAAEVPPSLPTPTQETPTATHVVEPVCCAKTEVNSVAVQPAAAVVDAPAASATQSPAPPPAVLDAAVPPAPAPAQRPLSVSASTASLASSTSPSSSLTSLSVGPATTTSSTTTAAARPRRGRQSSKTVIMLPETPTTAAEADAYAVPRRLAASVSAAAAAVEAKQQNERRHNPIPGYPQLREARRRAAGGYTVSPSATGEPSAAAARPRRRVVSATPAAAVAGDDTCAEAAKSDSAVGAWLASANGSKTAALSATAPMGECAIESVRGLAARRARTGTADGQRPAVAVARV
ncbi:Ceramide glucosyltransferase [Blastocladiella emersonii ATCC 22665]|nr:Ceramide glucosyltransferase [Blastocladiella emersonii ATCC 22665]